MLLSVSASRDAIVLLGDLRCRARRNSLGMDGVKEAGESGWGSLLEEKWSVRYASSRNELDYVKDQS